MENENKLIRESTLNVKQTILVITAIILVAGIFTFSVYRLVPVAAPGYPPYFYQFGTDWKNSFTLDIKILFDGGSPYETGYGLLPPWGLFLLSPLTLLPPTLAASILFVLTYVGFTIILFRLKIKPLFSLIFLLSPLILRTAWNGNIDWLAAMGFILPAPVGLFFVLLKPQIGAGIAVYWLIEAWQIGGIRKLIFRFAPVTTAYLISFVFYGPWPFKLGRMTDDPFNASIFPIGIPLAGVLIWQAVRQKKPMLAMAAGPFMSPYINYTSYAVSFLTFNPQVTLLAISTVVLWAARQPGLVSP